MGLTKIYRPKIRITLRKETHSQVRRVREIKVLLVQNQSSQGMVIRRHLLVITVKHQAITKLSVGS